MRFRWLLLSCLSVFLGCSPAEAGKLVFWRFESNENRLIFTTDAGVQPRAQLIFNPTRLVIDLPGTTLGSPTVKESIEGIVNSIRVGQFDPQTTRLVVELEPGYTIDPQLVEFRGISPTQWLVNLPEPERVEESASPAPLLEESNARAIPVSRVEDSREIGTDVRVTKNGLFIGLDGNTENKIAVERSRDRRQIEFELEGVTLPSHLASQTVAVGSYGVEDIQFTQDSTSPAVTRMTLNVSEDSSDWQASFSRLGGLVLIPTGGISAIDEPDSESASTPPPASQATVVSAELTDNNAQLLIRSEGSLNAEGNWNEDTGKYEITIPDSQLAASFPDPGLPVDSPILNLELYEDSEEQTVTILVQPAPGVQVEELEQLDNSLALQLQLPEATVREVVTISVPPPEQPLPPVEPSVAVPPDPVPATPSASTPQGQILVTLDPGHGGKDPGTIGINGVQEKNVVLPISKLVQQSLEKQGVRVQMTRDSDYFVTLDGRAQMANRAGSDLFVSIHANAINLSRPDVNGLETYYYQNGQRLAQTIHRNVLQSVSISDRRVRQARFYVLRKSMMPAVLVETGFLTGREDAANLNNESYRRQMAEAIAQGILEYIRQTE